MDGDPELGRAAWPAAEKKSLHALERDTEANRERRAEFHKTILTIAPEQLVFVDESGVTVGMTRRFGRCLGGKRLHEATPESHWKVLTILGAAALSHPDLEPQWSEVAREN